MRIKVSPTSIECPSPHSFLPAFTSSLPRSFTTDFHLNPASSKKSHNNQRGNSIRRSCRSNFDESFLKEPSRHLQGVAKSFDQKANHDKKVISKKSPFTYQDSFSHTRCDFLEPMMLGIRPEFPDRPDQETVVWATIEQKAKSLEIPLSLRMIKKKLQLEEGSAADYFKEDSTYCSVKAAFASMVSIIVELQSHALEMREALCREDLEIIIAKVQKEMHSSFIWLFQQVFSRTPDLMLHVMVLMADFSVYSTLNILLAEEKHLHQISQTSSSRLVSEYDIGEKTQISSLPQQLSDNQGDQSLSPEEMNLWNSMVDEAKNIRESLGDVYDVMQQFVSPISVEIEPDGYEDFLRTDLLYQMNLALDPNNPLLLCNYAQLLYLVAQDYDRAEECFKKAVQVLPPDAESFNQYANFLWTVRRDFWGAEEKFLQALATEPENSHYASRYANFLWSSGGDETCFPLKNS